MGGRGRGGGFGGRSTSSLTQEQLAVLGITGKEISNVSAAAPPPIFPTLPTKPVPLETRDSRDYKILWKEDFISYLKDSPYYTTHPKDSENKIQRYSDKYIKVLTKTKDKTDGDFAWNRMPAELRPNFKRKKQQATNVKRLKVVNVEEKLKALEQKEGKVVDPDLNKSKDSDADEDEEEQLEENDDEMDEDNDYGGNYFDNGDAYNEEDDNLDDGPTY